MVHRLYDQLQVPGLCELVRGEVDDLAVIRATAIDNLWIIPAGRHDDQALAVLSQSRTRAVFDRLRDRFDFVIVDSAPVLPVADACFSASMWMPCGFRPPRREPGTQGPGGPPSDRIPRRPDPGRRRLRDPSRRRLSIREMVVIRPNFASPCCPPRGARDRNLRLEPGRGPSQSYGAATRPRLQELIMAVSQPMTKTWNEEYAAMSPVSEVSYPASGRPMTAGCPAWKSAMDGVLACILLVLTAPLMMAAMVLVRLSCAARRSTARRDSASAAAATRFTRSGACTATASDKPGLGGRSRATRASLRSAGSSGRPTSTSSPSSGTSSGAR